MSAPKPVTTSTAKALRPAPETALGNEFIVAARAAEQEREAESHTASDEAPE